MRREREKERKTETERQGDSARLRADAGVSGERSRKLSKPATRTEPDMSVTAHLLPLQRTSFCLELSQVGC
jgi:hypothetical protein